LSITLTPDIVPRRSKRTRHPTGEAALSILTTLYNQVDPRSIKEAVSRSDGREWEQAILSELDSLFENNTWVPATAEECLKQKAIPSRMILTVKLDSDGNIKKHKARLVAGGHKQIENVDYEEVFAPTLRLETFRILLAIAASRDMMIDQIDVKTAFLKADIDAHILMKLPSAHNAYDSISSQRLKDTLDGSTVRLTGNLYGLKQGAKMWYEELTATLVSLGFIASEHDIALYSKGTNPEERIWIAIYVDDLVIISKSTSEMDLFKKNLKMYYTLSADEEVNHALGIRIKRDLQARTIHLSQPAKIAEIIIDAKMQLAKGLDSPYFPPPAEGDKKPFRNKELYASLVCKIGWIARCTRPDISIQFTILAKRLAAPTIGDWKNFKIVARYLITTMQFGITIGGETLVGYADALHHGTINCDQSQDTYSHSAAQ